MKFITLGQDCSPATALRNLNLREYALPFDWIRSTPEIVSRVIENNFNGFHQSLKLSENRRYVIDSYGLEFPHDYPTIKQDELHINDTEEAGGINEDVIREGWEDSIKTIQEKYKRRIDRFHAIMNADEPVIALYSGQISSIALFRDAFFKRYNKANIFYVVLSEEVVTDKETRQLLDEGISLCEPEEILVDENNNWFIDKIAQSRLWHDAINKIHLKI
jgi:hypothetical protein